MKPFYCFLSVYSLLFIVSYQGHGQLPCGNFAIRGADFFRAGCNGAPPLAGANMFEPYTGNVHREMMDLEIWGSVGEIPISFIRFSNSRFGNFSYNFGLAHNWNSSFNYNMVDGGTNAQGQPQLTIHYPEGGENMFTRDAANPNVWSPFSGVDRRLFQEGNDFYLQMANGHRYHFQRLTDNNNATYYQLQNITDNQQNLYSLTYDANRRLVRVTEPAGRYIQIDYKLVSNRPAAFSDVISEVTSDDGRKVTYNYDFIADPINGDWVSLSSVDYHDGTLARYSYSQSEPGSRPNLSHAIDPRYLGTAGNMRYTYSNNNAWGFIKEEINGVTGQVMATLIADSNGRTVCYPNGRIQHFLMPANLMGETKIYTDGLGSRTIYTYENEGSDLSKGPGFMTSQTDELGRKVTFNSRSPYGNALEITYPDNSKEKWTRDDLDLILTHTDRLEHVTTFTRDALHRITTILYPDGGSEGFTYNNFGEALDHTLRNAGVEKNSYDSRGLKTSYINAELFTTTYGYDAASHLQSATDARTNTTTYEYIPRGLLSRLTYADGTSRNYGYDSMGNRTIFTNELNATWIMSYDEFRRPVTNEDPLHRTTRFYYDLPGGVCGCSFNVFKPTRIVLPSGKVTELEYDVEWRKIRETVGAGSGDAATTFYEYDVVGNLHTKVDARSKPWVYEYDSWDRMVSELDPLGRKKMWRYDAAGNLLSYTRPDTGTTSNLYDPMNRIIQITDPKGQVSLPSYDKAGNMIRLVDPNGHATDYEFDFLNRRKKVTYSGGSFEEYSYDQVSNLQTYRNRAGNLRTYLYDTRNRETHSEWNDGSTSAIDHVYDPAGRVLSLSTGVSTLSYTYNAANQMTSETQTSAGAPGGKTIIYQYNADALQDGMTYPDGKNVGYVYSGRNQITAVSVNGAPALASYAYDLNGNVLTKTLANGTQAKYSYDDVDNILSINNAAAGVSFGRFDYGYDNVNRRTYLQRDSVNKESFSYDLNDQLTTAQYQVVNPADPGTFNTVRSVNYTWDAAGNRLNVEDNGTSSYTTNSDNEYTNIAGSSPAYDANGNLTSYNGFTYTYDAQNRMTSAVSNNATVYFLYDGRNRCIKRTVNGVATYFYYDKWKMIEETDAGGNEIANYVYGPNGEELLIRTSQNSSLFYHLDALGNVTHLTDMSGRAIETYTYDVFGVPKISDINGTTLAGSAFGNRFLFNGKEYIKELSLYYYLSRMYSPVLGRYLQPNPVSLDAGDYNLYRYVGNNPANWMDMLVSWDQYKDEKFMLSDQAPKIYFPKSMVNVGSGDSERGSQQDTPSIDAALFLSDYEKKQIEKCAQNANELQDFLNNNFIIKDPEDYGKPGAPVAKSTTSSEVKVHDEWLL